MVGLEISLNGNVIGNVGTAQSIVFINMMMGTSLSNGHDTHISLNEIAMRPASTGDDLAPKLRDALQYPEHPGSVQSVCRIDRKKLKFGDEITIKLTDVPGNDPAPSA